MESDMEAELASGYAVDDQLGAMITHAVGLVLALPAAVFAVTWSIRGGGEPLEVLSMSLYGATIIGVFAISSLYHAVSALRLVLGALQEAAARQTGFAPIPMKVFLSKTAYQWLRRLDHAAIFAAIAGSTTPLFLMAEGVPVSGSTLAVVLMVSLVGIVHELTPAWHSRRLRLALFCGFGLFLAYAAAPVVQAMPVGTGSWLSRSLGSLLVGLVFYGSRWPFCHTAWHVCVLAGIGCHAALLFSYLAQRG